MSDISKSLVEHNRPILSAFVGANAVLVYLAIVGYSPETNVASVIEAVFKSTAAMTLFGILAVLVGGLLPTIAKDRIVFLRWEEALPGHRAFDESALKDPRLNQAALLKKFTDKKFPEKPKDQNEKWYELYRKHDDKPSVGQVHASFMLTREMTIIGIMMLVVCSIAIVFKPELVKSAYFLYLGIFLVVETVLSCIAARNYGAAFVARVLVEESVA